MGGKGVSGFLEGLDVGGGGESRMVDLEGRLSGCDFRGNLGQEGIDKDGHTFMRVTRGHEKWRVDFEAPATALDGAGGGKLGEISIPGVREHS